LRFKAAACFKMICWALLLETIVKGTKHLGLYIVFSTKGIIPLLKLRRLPGNEYVTDAF
jgi:hypothetical protein